MAYKITLDFINRGSDHASEVGKGLYRRYERNEDGSFQLDENGDKILASFKSDEEMPHTFRLKDDDGEIYFHGISDDADSEKAFTPLDTIGASYGCTMIEYKNAQGAWEML